jgi:flagellar assembly factor FliW
MQNDKEITRFMSARFGELEIPSAKVIHIPGGIIGFPGFERYALIDSTGKTSPFLWLQAVDSPDLAFIITDPLPFVPEYQIQASEPGLERLGIEHKSAPALFVIVSIPMGDPGRMNINLMAPLIYFADENTISQVVLEKAPWPLRHYLIPQEGASACDAPGFKGENEGAQ